MNDTIIHTFTARRIPPGALAAGVPAVPSHPLRFELAWLPVVLAGILAIYLPGLDNAPVYDDAFLTDGRLFTLYGSWTLRERWLSYGSFVAVRELLGDGWWKQRLVNVSIHVAVSH